MGVIVGAPETAEPSVGINRQRQCPGPLAAGTGHGDSIMNRPQDENANPPAAIASHPQGVWHIRVFGEVAARWLPAGETPAPTATSETGPLTHVRFRTDKARLLLAYLAAHPGREQRRDSLAEKLWPGSPDPLQNLASELHYLKRAFGPEGDSLLKGSRRYVWLDPLRFRIDLSEFEADIQAARDPSTPEEERFALLSRAADAYRGPLLAHLYGVSGLDNWIVEVQTRTATLYAEALAALVRGYSVRGDRRQARAFALRIPDIALLGQEDRAVILEAVAGPEGAPDIPLLGAWARSGRAGESGGGGSYGHPDDSHPDTGQDSDLLKVLRHEEALRMAGAPPTEDESRVIARVVRAAIDALPQPERDLLARLSYLGASFTGESGRVLYRQPSAEGEAFPGRLDALVRGHFVRDLKGGRFTVPDAVRREAAPRLETSERTRLYRRNVALFCATVRAIDREFGLQGEERRKAYLSRVVSHTELLENALDALLPPEGAGTLGEPVEVSLAFRASRLVMHLGGFYAARGRFDRWAHFGTRILPLIQSMPPFWRDALFGAASYIAFETGQARHEEAAQRLFARLEALRPSASESVWLSTYLLRFGGGAPEIEDDMTELERRYLAPENPAHEGQWLSLIEVATLAHHSENDERAVRLFEFALPHVGGLLRVRALHDYADALAVQGRHADALNAAEESLSLLNGSLAQWDAQRAEEQTVNAAPAAPPSGVQRDARKRLVTLLALSGDLLHGDGRCGLALRRFQAALDELTLAPDAGIEESVLRDLGFLYITRGEFAAARTAFRASLQICEEKRLADAAAVARGGLGLTALRAGDQAGGEPLLEEALAHWALRRHHRWQARFLLPLAEAACLTGDEDAARARLAEVDEHVTRTLSPGSQSAAWQLRARLLLWPFAHGAATPRADLLHRALTLHRDALALRLRSCGLRDLVYSVEGIAGALALTARESNAREAGALWGTCAAARTRGEMPPLPLERAEQATLQRAARACIGDAEFDAAAKEGAARDLKMVARSLMEALSPTESAI